ncbi:MAG: putative diguanylate cyclase [Acidimicrobiaceae bacterium]|nr:putative diguanylate cyclase [Acidimicrobiaceae bacterium]
MSEIDSTAEDPPSSCEGLDKPDPDAIDRAVTRLEIDLYASLDGLDAKASALAEQASTLGLRSLELRCRLVEAEVLARSRDVPSAVELVHRVQEAATAEGHRVVLSRCHAVMARALDRLGARANSLDEAEQALQLLDDSSPLHLVLEHTMTLALLTSSFRSGTVSFDLFERSLELAHRLGEPIMQIAVLNNLAWIQYESGDLHAARSTVDDLITVAAGSDSRLNLSTVDTVARVMFELGDGTAAEEMLRNAIDGPSPAPQTDSTALPGALLSLAEILGRRDGPAAARAPLETCLALAVDRRLLEFEARVLRQLAHVFAAEGDFVSAYKAHVTFYERWEQLRATEGEAQAAALQALYDTELARRRSREFEQLAQRDPLTGLWNRRYLSDRLPRLVRIARRTGRPLSIAVADLDHFKRVNDELSHEIGDDVLVATGQLLRKVVEPTGFVVRFGGEEFLMVLPGCDGTSAVRVAEEVRVAMHAHPWRENARCWPITISIGVATLGETGDIAALITAGDTNMYRAKRVGRDRVIGEDVSG